MNYFHSLHLIQNTEDLQYVDIPRKMYDHIEHITCKRNDNHLGIENLYRLHRNTVELNDNSCDILKMMLKIWKLLKNRIN